MVNHYLKRMASNGPSHLGFTIILMALVVLTGWYTRSTSLIQITPYWAPMQYNTALCFLLCGVGILACVREKLLTANILSSLVFLLGSATLLQYVLGLNFGIDELFMEGYVLTETSHPGRMSPNTALCFTLSSASIWASQTNARPIAKRQSMQSLGLIIALMGTTSLFGYILDTGITYSWSRLVPMAAHTSLGFMMLGTCLILISRDISIQNQQPNDTNTFFPNSIVAAIVIITIGPLLLNTLGVGFASDYHTFNLTEVATWGLPSSVITEEMFYALSGAFEHALLEWSAVIIAFITALFSYLHYRIKGDITVPVIGIALLSSGLTDVFHTLASTRLLDAVSDSSDLVPFTWAVSRTFRATILLAGVILLFWFHSRKRTEQENKTATLILTCLSIVFLAVAIFIIQYASNLSSLPQTQFPQAIITRPYDTISLLMFLAILPLLWRYNHLHGTLFTSGLMLSLLPEIVLQSHMAFGSYSLYDNHFNIGHFLKIVAYMVPLTGLLLDYVSTYAQLNVEISKNKNAQKQLIKARDTAEEATRLKSEFLANMSHEIRTPMNGVIGSAGLLLDTALTSKQQHFANTIMSSADSLLSLINDILDFSKIEAGKLDFDIVAFDMQTLVEEVAEMMAPKAREKDIEVLLYFPTKTHRQVLGDPGRVRQILLNLVSNAIKFTSEGYVKIHIESKSLNASSVEFNLIVEDTGIGIPEDKVETIFNEFDQADTSTTRRFGGTGLGLSISHSLTKMMNGSIEVVSQHGKGSIFTAKILLECSEDIVKPENDVYNLELPRGLKLLAVDDCPTSLTIVREQLAGMGLHLETATSATDALEILNNAAVQEKPFDIVITDQCMPDMSGITMAEKIKETPALAGTKLILMTSAPEKGDGQRVKRIGFSGYLTKPIFPLEIPRAIAAVSHVERNTPAAPLVTRHALNTKVREQNEFVQFKNCHILLAEDNAVNRMVASNLLEKFGCYITPAGNGIEAVESATERQFDLIFMDCQMPEMDGYEATGKIREYEQKHDQTPVPIVAFTANAMQGDKEKCLKAGMDDYLSKPVQVKALENILAKWLPQKVTNTEQTEKVETNVLDHSILEDLKAQIGASYTEIIKSFLEFAKTETPKLEEAVKAEDSKTVREITHAFKSTSLQMGATGLHVLAEKMESIARSGHLENVDTLLSDFKVVCLDVCSQFEALLEKELAD